MGDNNYLCKPREYREDAPAAERRFEKVEKTERDRSDGAGFPLEIVRPFPSSTALDSQAVSKYAGSSNGGRRNIHERVYFPIIRGVPDISCPHMEQRPATHSRA